MQLIQDGRLRALAIVGPKRAPELPDVPAMPEVGFSRCHQRRLDRADGAARHAARHHRQAQRGHQRSTLHGDQMKNALCQTRRTAARRTPQDLSEHIQREVTKWKPIVTELHLQVD